MIKNQRQYKITNAQLNKLRKTLRDYAGRGDSAKSVHPALYKAQIEALESQIDELHSDIVEYESLLSGERKVIELKSFEDLPRALIQARIAAGLSQKDLADRLNLKEQQIQRYEATEYSSVSIARIKGIIKSLGIHVHEQVFLPDINFSIGDLFKRLKKIGIKQEFVMKKLIPTSLVANINETRIDKKAGSSGIALQLASYLGKIFGLSPSVILSTAPISIDTSCIGSVNFKTYVGTQKKRLIAYAVYAHYLALLILEATPESNQAKIPSQHSEFREQVFSKYGTFDLPSVLNYLWDSGIPIVPLNDPGAFHGACWRIDGRNIIVLKQKTNSISRWLFDLIHEVKHVTQEPELEDRSLIETEEYCEEICESEEDASRFAGDVILQGRAEELVQKCVDKTEGKVEWLRNALVDVARYENVSIDALANYMAFRLSLQGINWWGTANNLQPEGESPFTIARDILLNRVDLDRLNQYDREVVLQAMYNI